MKWFKHMADASSDEFIARLEDELGLEAIARWWKMLEAIAIQMDKTNRCFAEYPIRRWMLLLSCKQRKVLETFVKVLQNFGKISADWSENILKIECTKLLEFRDEYSKKSGVTPEFVRSKDTDTEEEERKERKNPPTPLPRGNDKNLFPVEESIKPNRFSDFYSIYPKKRDRRAAERAYHRAVTRATEAEIIAGAEQYAIERQNDPSPTRDQYTKNPSTWLNNDCWKNYDEIEGEDIAEENISADAKVARVLRQAGLS